MHTLYLASIYIKLKQHQNQLNILLKRHFIYILIYMYVHLILEVHNKSIQYNNGWFWQYVVTIQNGHYK